MDIKTYIQQQMGNLRSHIDTVIRDTTDVQFNWSPPGTINPISAILIHMLMAEDYFIQTVLQGKSPYWEVEAWGRKIGVQTPPGQGSSWDEFRTLKLSVSQILDYERAIRAATDIYLDDLPVEELSRRVNFAGNELSVAQMLMTLVVHSASHAGEIAAVKGMQGIRGLPY